MKQQSDIEETLNSDSNQISDANDYDSLLVRLEDIKKSISQLENYILHR
tara:strand:+ start:598 stop:744 length:147 start_codon:yes stop_codon:yes gene_type:complete